MKEQCFGVSNLWPTDCMCPRMAVNVAQEKIINLLKTLDFFVIMCHNMFNMWPKTILLLVWPRAPKCWTLLVKELYVRVPWGRTEQGQKNGKCTVTEKEVSLTNIIQNDCWKVNGWFKNVGLCPESMVILLNILSW